MERVKLFQAGSPVKLKIVGTIDADVESQWHELFHRDRMRGEWFDNTEHLVSEINRVCEDGCASAEDYNDLYMSNIAKLSHYKDMVMIHKDHVDPAKIKMWDELDRMTRPEYAA